MRLMLPPEPSQRSDGGGDWPPKLAAALALALVSLAADSPDNLGGFALAVRAIALLVAVVALVVVVLWLLRHWRPS